jgi:hypothetical protein
MGCTFGVLRLARNGFTSYGFADGLPSTRVASIFEDHAGQMFVITTGAHVALNQWDGRHFAGTRFKPPPSKFFTTGWYQIAVPDHAGDLVDC